MSTFLVITTKSSSCMRKILVSCAVALLGLGTAKSQNTAQVGLGTEVSANTLYAPVYRFSATSTTNGQRSNILYTDADLASAGITAGATIESISFHKMNGNRFNTPSQFKVLMANSAKVPPLSTATTWSSILGTHTPVYQNTSFNLPDSAGWVTWAITPFVYNGGSLEIAFENAMGGNGAATGNFQWEYTAGFGEYAIGVSSATGTVLNGGVDAYKQRPNIRFGYTPGTACAGMPAGGTTTGPASVCPNVVATFTVAGATSASGLAYQWQSSPDGFMWNDIASATGFSYSTPVTSALSFRRLTICLATQDTAMSQPVYTGVTPFLYCYCSSNATATTNSSIRNVTFSNINNTSASACDEYTDFSSVTGVVSKGADYAVSVLVEDCEGTGFGTQRVAIFIDWNHDGDFTDSDELVYDPGTLPPAASVLFSGSVSIPLTVDTGVTRMRVINRQATANIDPCGTYTTGETEDYLLHVVPQPADEVGIQEITRPEPLACNLGSQLWVNLTNWGSNALTQVNFAVQVNGISVPVNNPWTGNVPSLGTGEVQVPTNFTWSDGDSISVEVSMPNGVAEDTLSAVNNFTSRTVWQSLSGTKTINGPAGPNNFANIDAATAALVLRGVCDTVTFRIAPGTYNSQHIFPAYPGAGAGRLAIFESATGNAADVLFVDSNSVPADNYIFRFDAGSHYALRNITGISKSPTHCRVVDILNEADDLTFEGNTFIGDTLGTYSAFDINRGVVVAGTDLDRNTVLRGNHIVGGNRGISLDAPVDAFESGLVVENNLIEKFSYAGIVLDWSSGPVVRGNTLLPLTTIDNDAFGVRVSSSANGAIIEKNEVRSNRRGAGVYLDNCKGFANPVLVSNNFLYMGDTTSTGRSRGIYVEDENSIGILIVNNSIATYHNSDQGGAITVWGGTEIEVHNNNVGSFGAAPALHFNETYSVTASNHNNLFGTHTGIMDGTPYTTLADWQAATSFDGASVNVNPGYNGTDLHTCAPELNAAAASMPYVSDDFDGDTRAGMPDIGADEFVGGPQGLLAQNDILKCPAEAVTLGNDPVAGVTYTWAPTGNTSEISATAEGTYVVTATSACGVFMDTATVANKPLPDANFTATQVGLAAVFTNMSTGATSYVWDFGDGNTSTEVSPSHVYGTGGTYTATLTATSECGTDTYGPVPVNVYAAGINEVEAKPEASLFPNPSNGQFTVTMSGLANEPTVISVIDITGKTVLVHKAAAGITQVSLDATAFASGMYSVKISNGGYSKVIRLVRK